MTSISELRRICQKDIKGKDVWTWFEVQRRFSIYFTKMFVVLGVSANRVTLINLCIMLVATSLFFTKSLGGFVVGFLLLQLYFVLDCSDGEVARFFGCAGAKGLFVDRLVHVVSEPLLFLSLGVYCNNIVLAIVPALCCENGLRLVGWGHEVSFKEEASNQKEVTVKSKSKFVSLFRFLAIYGFCWLLLGQLVWGGWVSLLLVVWSVWTPVSCVYLTVKLL